MNPLTIFTGPYALLAKWGIIIILLLSVGVFGWVKGNDHGTQKLTDYIGKQAVETVRIGKARDLITQNTLIKYIKVKGKTELVTSTIDREVIKYAEANTTMCLDAEWRMLHDSAAINTVPDPTKRTDGTSGAPTASEAIEGVTSNYGKANRNADKLEALQQWVRDQMKVK